MMGKLSPRSLASGIVVCLLLWSLAAHLLHMPVVPPPAEVFARLAEKFTSVIAIHAGYSLMRIALGLSLAVAVGYPLGILTGYFPCVRRALSPVLYLTYPIPKIALLPVVMLLFGVGEAGGEVGGAQVVGQFEQTEDEGCGFVEGVVGAVAVIDVGGGEAARAVAYPVEQGGECVHGFSGAVRMSAVFTAFRLF